MAVALRQTKNRTATVSQVRRMCNGLVAVAAGMSCIVQFDVVPGGTRHAPAQETATGRQAGRQTDRRTRTHRQTDRQTDRQSQTVTDR